MPLLIDKLSTIAYHYFSMIASFRALKKSKRIFRHAHRRYLRKKKNLEPSIKEEIQSHLSALQEAILQKKGETALQLARRVEEDCARWMPRTLWDKIRDFTGAIGFALLVAIAIRQMWFELYTIPTGSMRPTLKENDFLVVSKTDFGINIPLRPSHFYFDPSLVERGSIVIFTGEGMDIPDADTTYFYLFPGKKQFVKRLIGKPGDTLYFYGGKLYGIDREGHELKMLQEASWGQNLEHIPFIRFDGKVEVSDPSNRGVFSSSLFYQMNQLIAKLRLTPLGTFSGEMIPPLPHYADLWGFKNFGMARLLTAKEVALIYPEALKDLGKGVLYLEITHHPSLKGARLIRDEQNRVRPDLGLSTSLLPLQQQHIEAIAHAMTTCRFRVEKGVATRLGAHFKDPAYARYFPHLPNVPDGTYEIQGGLAYQIYWGGIAQRLPHNHPLYRTDPAQVQLLYNLGIEFFTQYNPSPHNPLFPSRYTYFRDGALYLLGAPILFKEDPALDLFQKRERQKEVLSTSVHPYFPFSDAGPPLTKEGTIDAVFLKQYGLTIPEKMYLVLGDNHAMSADSRQFGFVPENNLRGGASFLFWPFGPRWGRLPQPSSPHLTFPNLVIWGSALLIAVGSSLYAKRKLQRPL